MEMIHDEVSDLIICTAGKVAKEKSAGKVTVRDILKEMGITNRVFYNRFHNIEEVLDILYKQTVMKVRESLSAPLQPNTDFFDHVITVASQTLVLSYATKQNLSQFIFETDSATDDNFTWWDERIRELIRFGKNSGQLRDNLDEGTMSYAIWCFIRGFNADAMARCLPEEIALDRFRYGFSILLAGMAK